MKPKKINLFLFDWDGVICDSLPIFHTLYCKLYPEYIIKKEDFREHIFTLHQKGLPILPGRLSDYSELFYTSDLFPEMENLLKSLKVREKKLVLVSNSPFNIIDHHLKKYNLSEIFDGIYSSNYKYKKPDVKLLNEIKNKFEISDSETVFIGDQISDLLFIKDTNYLKYFSTYGFQNQVELAHVETSLQINNVHYFNNSKKMARALDLFNNYEQ